MNHEKAVELLSDFRDAELSEADRDDMGRHLAVCRECRHLLAEWEKTATALFPCHERPTTAQTESFVQKAMGRIRRERPAAAACGPIDYRWFLPALGFSFAALLLSLLPLGSESADPASAILLEGASGGVFADLITGLGSQTPEDMLHLVVED